MKHTSLLASIAAAAGADRTTATPHREAAAPKAPPQAASPQTFQQRVAGEWETDATLRSEFRSFAAYDAYRHNREAKARGVTVAELRGETPDVAGFLASLRNPTRADELAANECAATWAKSPDIRREFRTFATFAHYTRAKNAGRAKTFGS